VRHRWNRLSSCQAPVAREVVTRLSNSGQLVVSREWRQLDGNVQDHPPIGLEALAQPIKVGQVSGVEISVDCLGEFGPRRRGGASKPTMVRQACFSVPLASSASNARA
jgi:hypothetical protein